VDRRNEEKRSDEVEPCGRKLTGLAVQVVVEEWKDGVKEGRKEALHLSSPKG
jgi:hypothetical protein